MPLKQNLVHHVHDTAMHLLYDSYLFRTTLWPTKGFTAGWGIESDTEDCIHVVVNAWGYSESPQTGVLVFNIHNTERSRRLQQVDHLRILFHQTISNDLYFEDPLPTASLAIMNNQAKFHFTYTPTF